MDTELHGIHHVTALASDPQRNLDFYVGLLGMRLVKKTVNFDAPDVYHLYYGDEEGHPGSLLTFFPFPHATRGRRGHGQATAVAFSIPQNSLDYWMGMLAARAVHFDGPMKRFDEDLITFEDPDGMLIELVTDSSVRTARVPTISPVPPEHAIRGFYGVTLSEQGFEQTARVLSETLGFHLAASSGSRRRFVAGRGPDEAKVDLINVSDGERGRMSAGSVHHIAWRTPGREEQERWRDKVGRAGLDVTPVVDRQYFTSIYFHEPGGVLFEIATDPPGFTVDEPLENLGRALKLPPWLEDRRERLELLLPAIRIPDASLHQQSK